MPGLAALGKDAGFSNAAGNSCFNQTDLKSVTVNPATGGVYVLDQGDLNPQKTSVLDVGPSPGL